MTSIAGGRGRPLLEEPDEDKKRGLTGGGVDRGRTFLVAVAEKPAAELADGPSVMNKKKQV